MLSDIKGIGDVTEKKLRTLGITDERDLVERTPKSYMDMSVIALPQESAEGDFCLFEAELTNLSKPFKKGNLENSISMCHVSKGKYMRQKRRTHIWRFVSIFSNLGVVLSMVVQ